ncbi:CNNM domain-containing protein [Halodesulfovibrio marinisediminis]|uniref:Hemolysin, contains CBS domains n=1 Tax=Halodesulfovibrio marinisediminis DSM 17456 TaxID=1121457 RepID=A0A1N6IC56_9BACT|nr:hemolysin family protein [Halodesulfovibrio marinisediminis]SIO29597.1 Hemolysin, contains CBS domains [Halodesulfovibrio marinisediminis DSM 17456]
MFELITAVTFSIVVSATCSITEAILYALPWSHIERLRSSGSKAGTLLFKLRSDVERPITAILTLNTVANTAGATIAGAAFTKVYGAEYMPYFAIGFTVSILIFSEILPKTIGVSYASQLSRFIARPLNFLVFSLTPIIYICSWMTRKLTPSEKGPKATEDDILAIVSLSRRAGQIESSEEVSIKNILSLDLKHVNDVMTPRTVTFTLPVDFTVKEAQQQLDLNNYSRIPVYAEDNEDIVGVVMRRYIYEELASGRTETRLSELMRPVHFVLDSVTLDKVLRNFLERRDHLFVAVDEYGGVSGVVSLEDVLEEILGKEIVDETDRVDDMQLLARKKRKQLGKRKLIKR